MKNLFLTCVITLFTILGSFAQSKLIEPVIGKDIFLESNSINGSSKLPIFVDLGRSSRRCRGFGICLRKPKRLSFDIVSTIDDSDSSRPFFYIYLAAKIDATIFDTNLYVDEDLKCTDDNLIISRDIYQLDNSIGKFGGYKIILK